MTTRTLFVLIGFYSLVLAGGLAALNVVYAYRLAMRGEGPRPIPGLVTLLGLVAGAAPGLGEIRARRFGGCRRGASGIPAPIVAAYRGAAGADTTATTAGRTEPVRQEAPEPAA